MYLLALLDSVLKNIGEACAVLVIYVAQAGALVGWFFDVQLSTGTRVDVFLMEMGEANVVCGS